VRTNYFRRALQPGDSAVFHARQNLKPSRQDYAEANEILKVQRREYHSLVDSFSRETVDQHMTAWFKDQEDIMKGEPIHEIVYATAEVEAAMDIDADPDAPPSPLTGDQARDRLWDYISVERSHREFVARLIIQSCFDIYTAYACRSQGCAEFLLQTHGFVDDAALPPPLDMPPPDPDSCLDSFVTRLGYKPPFLVVLSHMYSVLTPVAVRITPRYEEAVLMWLREAVDQGHLSSATIHPALHPLLLPDAQLVASQVVAPPTHVRRLEL
jgi:hypothetical protein